MSFLYPAYLWLLAAIPLVVALHFLRNRRRHQLVSALFLWKQASDQASERRRFALWWLLLLQVLAVAALAAALAQPVLPGRGVPDRVLIVDASASMAAEDPDGVRLVKALAEAGRLVSAGGRVALIRAGSTATVLAPLDASSSDLAVALAGLRAADATADLDGALQLASAVAPEAEVHLFTDQPATGRQGVEWHSVAGGGLNLGISTFDLGPQQAFVAITSSWPQPQLVTVELEQDGNLAGSAEVLVPASGQGNITFPTQADTGVFRARVVPPEADALSLDDEAWAGSRLLSYYVLGESEPLQRALAAVPGLAAAPSAASADVLVSTDADRALTLPAQNLLLFRERSASPEYFEIRDWDQSDPLLRFVDLQGAQVGLDPSWQPDPAGDDRAVARVADLRPVLLVGEREGRRTVQLGFDPAQSDLIYRPAFPTLVANVIRYFRGEATVRLGALLPEGATLNGEPVTHALEPGVYEVPGGQLSASLLSASESRIPGPQPAAAEGPAAGTATSVPAGDRSLVRWLLVLLPLLLLAEWLLWSRRSARVSRRLIKSGQ